MTTNKQIEETLRKIWERLPDNITSNDLYYSTQIEPHIKRELQQTQKDTLDKVREQIKKIHTFYSFADSFKGNLHIREANENLIDKNHVLRILNQLEKGE